MIRVTHRDDPLSPGQIYHSFRLAWWAILLGAVLVVGLYSYSSSGLKRIGEDEEGSGIGGTGRQLVPGSGSGFGGTGLRPYLGLSNDSEVKILEYGERGTRRITESVEPALPDKQEINLPPMPAPARVTQASWLTNNSAAIDISEHIQHELTVGAMQFEAYEIDVPVSRQASADAAGEDGSPDGKNTPDWQDLADYLASSADERRNEDAAGAEDTNADEPGNKARIVRPDRLQRPQLPPLQRIRPVRRTTVLPPRIKPMTL